MPDTGVPWNLPYPAPSDLVRDAPQAFENLADAVSDALPILQLKAATDATDRTTTSTTYVSATIELAFTPLAANSLLVVEWSGRVFASRSASSTTLRRINLRLLEVGGSALSGAENTIFGRQLIASSDQASPTNGTLLIRGFVTSGSTAARTYRLEFKANESNTNAGIENSETTGRITVTEYVAGVL